MKTQAFAAVLCLLGAPQFAVAGCNIESNYTIIDSPSDTDAVNSCETIDGSLSLLFGNDPSAWSSDEASVDLGSVNTIAGDFIVYPDYRSKKTQVTASNLKEVHGALTIQNIDTSSTINELDVSFPALEYVEKDYVITGGFAKISVEYSTDVHVQRMFRIYDTEVESLEVGGPTKVDGDFSIDSNSQLKQLDAEAITTAESGFDIKENGVLEKLTLSKLKTVGGDLIFYNNPKLTRLEVSALESAETISWSSNGQEPLVSFPRLSSLGKHNTTSTSTFKEVSTIQLPSLRNVNGSLAFQSTAVESLVVPLVKTINGGITIESNPSMTTFALPRVKSVEQISIKDNDALTNVTANALKSAGTISLKGSFKNVEFFGLEEVTGDFKVVGDDSMDCSWFDDNVSKIVKGKYSCVGSREESSSERKPSTGGIEDTEGDPDDYIVPLDGDDGDSSSDDPSNSGSGDSDENSNESGGNGGLSAGAKAGIGVGCAVGAIGFLAVAVWLALRRRKNKGKPAGQEKKPPSKGDEGGSVSDLGVYDGKGLGVHTTIQATSVEPQAPSLGVLDFAKSPFLDTKDPNGTGAWKTIRRVSDSTASGASKDTGFHG